MDYIASKLKSLHAIMPIRTARDDYDAFWERLLANVLDESFESSRAPLETDMIGVQAFQVTYAGYAGTPIQALYLLPPGVGEGLKPPCLVMAHGYTMSKGQPEHYAAWLLRGYAVIAFDIRGQSGETGNTMAHEYGTVKGWITQGILNKETCYYKAITFDALRAVEWASAQPEIDPERIVFMGASQGGGLALLTAAFHPNVRLAVADIPNMCQMDFGIYHSTGSLSEAAEFVNRHPEHYKQVMDTLSYFDAVNCAARIRVPVLVSVSLKDTVCWPETVFAAYHAIPSQKELQVYPFAGHYTPEGHERYVHSFIQGRLN